MAKNLYLGLDVGSTTVKQAYVTSQGVLVYSSYQRHFSDIHSTLCTMLAEAEAAMPGVSVSVAVTGSAGMGLSQMLGFHFVQEVMASTVNIRRVLPHTDVAIELGGEDAKITFFDGGIDQRMNETCAGGTGAFIDQMASFLQTDAAGLNEQAKGYSTLYPIASRCGVFAKTDIMPLLNEGAARSDIAASIFQAVVDQTVGGLACGRAIRGNVAFLGGPLFFLSELRQRFIETLGLRPDQVLFPEQAQLFVAKGAALAALDEHRRIVSVAGAAARGGSGTQKHSPFSCPVPLAAITLRVKALAGTRAGESATLPPLVSSNDEFAAFTQRHASHCTQRRDLAMHVGPVFVGFDAGSTTIKAAVIDETGTLLHSHYGHSQGEPLASAVGILRDIYARLPKGAFIAYAGATGYGGSLIRAAFGTDIDEVETVAHFTATRHLVPEVSFILDIGGQDMKCLHIENGIIDRIMLNEACSAGCGVFVETFAKSLGMDNVSFVQQAFSSQHPIDLGSRCTVFMNSKVKQAQKEGASVGDIAAGLAYSVIRNALYKVIKMPGPEALGSHVVAQGGAFLNDSLLRAFELLLGQEVYRPDIAGLMGAYGVALLARDEQVRQFELIQDAGQWSAAVSFASSPPFASSASPASPPPFASPSAFVSLYTAVPTALITSAQLDDFVWKTKTMRCRRCGNQCLLTLSLFSDGRRHVSGNRCEQGAGATSEADRHTSSSSDCTSVVAKGLVRREARTKGVSEHDTALHVRHEGQPDGSHTGCSSGSETGTEKEHEGRRRRKKRHEERRAKKLLTARTPNLYSYKYQRLFDWYAPLEQGVRGVIGIPRVLNMYENYPFWFTFFTRLGYRVELSAPTSTALYNSGLATIPSQTACYPAKLAHGHILDLVGRGIKDIFYPCIPNEIHEFPDTEANFNCPVVASYPEVLRLNIDALQEQGVTMHIPFLPLDNTQRLAQRLSEEMPKLPGGAQIRRHEILQAVAAAAKETERFRQHIRRVGTRVLCHTLKHNEFALVLAGHPYHIDPGISHGIADMVAGMGVAVLTEDCIAHLVTPKHPLRVVNQWTYHARLYRAAALSTLYGKLGIVQFTSFGCGIDAVTSDQVQEILEESGCIFTLLKIDEGTNLGAARIRIRSLLAAERARLAHKNKVMVQNEIVPVASGNPAIGKLASGELVAGNLASGKPAIGMPVNAATQGSAGKGSRGQTLLSGTYCDFSGFAQTVLEQKVSVVSAAVVYNSAHKDSKPKFSGVPGQALKSRHKKQNVVSGGCTACAGLPFGPSCDFPGGSGCTSNAQPCPEGHTNLSVSRLYLDPIAGRKLPPPDPVHHVRRGGRPLYSELRVPFTKAMRDTHTILIPQFAPIHFQMVEKTVGLDGYTVKLLPSVDKNAIETGLKYVNNDVCYPALMVVGQLIQAVQSGEYDPHRVALIVSQTGGGCRATNYISFLRKGLANAGLSHVPVLSFNVSGFEEHSGFSVSGPMLGRIVRGSLYGDLLARLFYRVRPYEKEKGQAQKTLERMTARCCESLENTGRKMFSLVVNEVVEAFAAIPVTNEKKPRVGVVGEIYLRLNPDANNNIMDIIESEGGEAVPGDFANFILYCLYDEVFRAKALTGHWKKAFKSHLKIWWIERLRNVMRRALSKHPRFGVIDSLYSLVAMTKPVIQLGHQTGEGWLLTAEMIDFINNDIPNIICLQPFGCLPNHVTGKGVIKELKRIYPAANITPIDYDAGASEVNQLNRIKLMMAVAKENMYKQEAVTPEASVVPMASSFGDTIQDSAVSIRQAGLPKK